jgi:hypothetical protein
MNDERETSGYKYRVAPGKALTGNGAILLSSHSPSVEAEQAAIRRRQWGQLGENLGGVKFPWCGLASRRLMTSLSCLGVSRTNKDILYISQSARSALLWQLLPMLFLQR